MVTMDTKEAPRSEPAIQPTAQPTVFIVVQSPEFTPDKIHFEKTFWKKLVTVLATLQLISAALAFIFQIALISKNDQFSSIGAGIWSGFFFGISGGLGMLAAYKPSNCSIIAFMVMTIISSIFCIPLLIISSIGLGNAERRRDFFSYLGEPSVTENNRNDLIRIHNPIPSLAAQKVLQSWYQAPLNGLPAGFPFGSGLASGSNCNDPPPGYSSSVEMEASGEDYRQFS